MTAFDTTEADVDELAAALFAAVEVSGAARD
jgi:hypothetical protein